MRSEDTRGGSCLEMIGRSLKSISNGVLDREV